MRRLDFEGWDGVARLPGGRRPCWFEWWIGGCSASVLLLCFLLLLILLVCVAIVDREVWIYWKRGVVGWLKLARLGSPAPEPEEVAEVGVGPCRGSQSLLGLLHPQLSQLPQPPHLGRFRHGGGLDLLLTTMALRAMVTRRFLGLRRMGRALGGGGLLPS